MPSISQQTVYLHTPSRCIDMSETTGCRASGFNKESADCHSSLCLPTLIECNTLPDNQSEIQTHDVAWIHTHHMCRKDPTTGFWGWHSFITLTWHYLLHGWSTQGTRAIQWISQCPGCSEASTMMGQGGMSVLSVKPTLVEAFRTNILDKGRSSLMTEQLSLKEQFQPLG